MLDEILDYNVISRDIKIIKEDNNHIYLRLRRSNKDVRLPKQINQEIAYLFGAIMGDGNLSLAPRLKSKKKSVFPTLRLSIYNNSKRYLEKLELIFKRIFECSTRIYKKPDNNCYVLEIGNKLVWLYFSKYLNIKNKKVNLKVPNEVKNIELFKYFLAGLFDTDGYFSSVYGIMMGGTNYDFLEEIYELIHKLYGIEPTGLRRNILYVEDKTYYRCYFRIKTSSTKKFDETIPLIHEKYV